MPSLSWPLALSVWLTLRAPGARMMIVAMMTTEKSTTAPTNAAITSKMPIRNPAIPGATTRLKFIATWFSAKALSMLCSGTRLGISALRAGWLNTMETPRKNENR